MDTRNLPRLSDVTKAQVQDALSLDYAKWLSCLSETAVASSARAVYLERYPHTLGASLLRKAATLPGTTTDPAWAGPLACGEALR